jgi:dihydroorotate dehydrogenase electron transfer subunit
MSMFQRTASITEHVAIAERTFRMRLQCPEIAGAIRPGQFVMVRIPGRSDPLLARPFALYDTSEDFREFDIVYLVVGKMTSQLALMTPGEMVEVWGPLGKPFLDVGTQERVTFVAGGIGQTPFLAYARELLGERGFGGDAPRKRTEKVELFYGIRTKSLAGGIGDFEKAGVEVHHASDDGSIGFKGYVTQLLENQGKRGPLVGCGPEPMLHKLRKLAVRWDVPCQVSLETPMACGVGACFSCVTKVCTGVGSWDYQRVCVEGPAFDAHQLAWE